MLDPPRPIDTRHLFRPVSRGLVTLLRALPAGHWDLPTIAGQWLVRDVVAHLLDSTLRRLAWHRDGMTPPAPPRAITSERDFVRDVAVRSLPHAFRDVTADAGDAVALDIEGASGGRWTLSRGEPVTPVARVRLSDEAACRLLCNALSEEAAADAVHVEGRADLGRAFLRARSVIV